MLIRELHWFRDNIAMPRLQQLMDNTTIPEGYCCITDLYISLLDCRSCGLDSELTAKGLIYQNGKVEEYNYNVYDFATSGFYEEHKDAVFLSDGVLHIQDELQEMEVHTVLRNIGIMAELFPDLKKASELQVESSPLEYLKMKQLMESEKKAYLEQKIKAAALSQDEQSAVQRQPPINPEQER